MKGRDERSRGIVTRIADAFAILKSFLAVFFAVFFGPYFFIWKKVLRMMVESDSAMRSSIGFRDVVLALKASDEACDQH